jgi:hypothetical protein
VYLLNLRFAHSAASLTLHLVSRTNSSRRRDKNKQSPP